MFASKSLTEHLLRGALGASALAGAVAFASLGWPAVLLVPLGLVALRGCPMCWTVGLAQTLWAKTRGRPAGDACADGRCALSGPARPSSLLRSG
jgi:hypothetical protein